MEYIRVGLEKISFSITTHIIRITPGQSESGHAVQGNHTLLLGRTTFNAKMAKAVADPATPSGGW